MLAVKKSLANSNLAIFRRTSRLMGDDFEISVVGNDPILANKHIDLAINEIGRVEKLLSTFSDESIINQINRNAGKKPVKVSAEIFNMFSRALQISALTYGVFDITYSTDKDLHTPTPFADSNVLTKEVYCINYKDVVLNAAETTVFLKEKNMRVPYNNGRFNALNYSFKIPIAYNRPHYTFEAIVMALNIPKQPYSEQPLGYPQMISMMHTSIT